jgi:hypothetical protein
MSLILDGTNGVSDIDGSAATPAIRGTDTNTGIFFPAADTIAFSEGGVESMRIDTSGNLGIGTTSPAYRLDVVNSSGTSYAQVKGANSGTTITTPGNGGATVFLMNTNSTANTFNAIYGVDAGENVTSGVAFINNSDANNEGTMAFMTRPSGGSITERMRIDSSGYSKFSNSGSYIGGSYHEFTNNANTETLIVENTNASFSQEALLVRTSRNTSNNSYYFFRGSVTGVASRILVADSGNVTNTNGSYGTISDIKNKENIVDATPKLDKVNQLQVRNFNFKGDDLKQIGFVAQEFEQVFPSMVEEHHDKDAEGNDLGTTTKSIKTSVLVPILVKAIQEQQAMITELKATVDAQAARIAALEAAP